MPSSRRIPGPASGLPRPTRLIGSSRCSIVRTAPSAGRPWTSSGEAPIRSWTRWHTTPISRTSEDPSWTCCHTTSASPHDQATNPVHGDAAQAPGRQGPRDRIRQADACGAESVRRTPAGPSPSGGQPAAGHSGPGGVLAPSEATHGVCGDDDSCHVLTRRHLVHDLHEGLLEDGT